AQADREKRVLALSLLRDLYLELSHVDDRPQLDALGGLADRAPRLLTQVLTTPQQSCGRAVRRGLEPAKQEDLRSSPRASLGSEQAGGEHPRVVDDDDGTLRYELRQVGDRAVGLTGLGPEHHQPRGLAVFGRALGDSL